MAAIIIAVCLVIVTKRSPDYAPTSIDTPDTASTSRALADGVYLVYQTMEDVSPVNSGVMTKCKTTLYRKQMDAPAEVVLSREEACHSYRLQGGVVIVPGEGNSTAIGIDGTEAPLPAEEVHVSSASGAVTAVSKTDIDTGKTTLRVFSDRGESLQARVIDPDTLRLRGYLSPIAVSDDGEVVYLQEQIEHDWLGAVSLWTYAWRTGELKEVAYIREQGVHWDREHGIDLARGLLVGITYALSGDGIDANPVGPFEVHLVDIGANTGHLVPVGSFGAEQRIEQVWINSDDLIAVQMCVKEVCNVVIQNAERTVVEAVSGRLQDWFGTTMVLEHEGELVVQDTQTWNRSSVAIQEEKAPLKYLGHVMVE